MKSSHHYPGYLIVIEGIDGTGKTTQAQRVQEKLQTCQLPVVRSKEPTTGHWGQRLRDSALTGRMSAEEELETFIKDRREHVDRVILPELRDGKVILIDRYYFSNMAYQGARGLDPEEIRRRNEAFAPEPDLLVILDLEPNSGLERIRTRGDQANQFEETRALAKAREIFNRLDKPYLYRLDARQPAETVCDSIVRRFSEVVRDRIAHAGESATAVSESFRRFAGGTG